MIIMLGDTHARCTICGIDISVSHGGRNDVTKHISVKNHRDMASASASSRSISSFLRPSTSQKAIEAEMRWALFVAKHNLAFLTSDHAAKLFGKMFSDFEVAKSFTCG